MMDNAGRISQSDHHAALDRRDKRIAELEAALRRIYDILENGLAADVERRADEMHDIAAEALGIKTW